MKNKFVLGLVAAAGATIALSACGNGTPKATFNNEVDSVSYAFGMLNGGGFAQAGDSGMVFPKTQLNMNKVLDAFQLACKKDTNALKVSFEEAQTLYQDFASKTRMAANDSTFTVDQKEADEISYAFGVLNGTQFSQVADTGVVFPETAMNVNNVLAGFITAAKRDSAALVMTAEEAQQICMNYSRKMQEAEQAKQLAIAKENKDKGAAFMAENGKKNTVVTTESGLQYEVVTEGKGKTPTADDKVSVFYRGTLLDGTEFDSNVGKDAATFPLNGVIKGFSEALQLMKEGSKYNIWLPADLAYGDRNLPNIPAGSTLKFELELVKVNPESK